VEYPPPTPLIRSAPREDWPVNFRMRRDVHKALKLDCIKRGVPLGKTVERLIARYLRIR